MVESVSLLDHFTALLAEKDLRDQQRFDAQKEALAAAMTSADKAVIAALTAQKEAVAKAEMAANDRAEAANGLRGLLADQASTFVPRIEFNALAKTVTGLTARMDTAAGSSAGSRNFWGYIVGAGGFLIGLSSIVITILK